MLNIKYWTMNTKYKTRTLKEEKSSVSSRSSPSQVSGERGLPSFGCCSHPCPNAAELWHNQLISVDPTRGPDAQNNAKNRL